VENGFAFWGNSENLVTLHLIIGAAAIFGMCVCFLISYLISKKKKHPVTNALIVLLLLSILIFVGSLTWTPLKNVMWLPGQITDNIIIQIVLNGLILLVIGCCIFFSKYSRRFIDYGVRKIGS
jgi:uncharacterized membrane protein